MQKGDIKGKVKFKQNVKSNLLYDELFQPKKIVSIIVYIDFMILAQKKIKLKCTLDMAVYIMFVILLP